MDDSRTHHVTKTSSSVLRPSTPDERRWAKIIQCSMGHGVADAVTRPAGKIDSEAPREPLPVFSADQRRKVVLARTSSRLTQVDLARRCNLQVNVIQAIESGQPVHNLAAVRRRLSSVLGVDLTG